MPDQHVSLSGIRTVVAPQDAIAFTDAASAGPSKKPQPCWFGSSPPIQAYSVPERLTPRSRTGLLSPFKSLLPSTCRPVMCPLFLPVARAFVASFFFFPEVVVPPATPGGVVCGVETPGAIERLGDDRSGADVADAELGALLEVDGMAEAVAGGVAAGAAGDPEQLVLNIPRISRRMIHWPRRYGYSRSASCAEM